MGYKFQFVTLAGFHSLNAGMFQLAAGYKKRGMSAYAELQEGEFAAEAAGYTATKHQREVQPAVYLRRQWDRSSHSTLLLFHTMAASSCFPCFACCSVEEC